MNRNNLGWVVAGVLALGMAGIVGAGFQDKAQKFGVVSMADVYNKSAFAKKSDAELKSLGSVRGATLEFMESYKMLPTADLKRFHDLSIKPTQTDGDKAAIEKIRTDGAAADAKMRELQTKAAASDAEKTQLATYTKNVQDNQQYVSSVRQEFNQELGKKQQTLNQETLDRVKTAIQEVAAKQGYSVVLDDSIAPYAANNVTNDALAAMDAKK